MEQNIARAPTNLQRGDITTLDDIHFLVDTFYGRGRKDELIGPVFEAALEGRWADHFQQMYDFWATLLLEARTYRGQPFMPHAPLPITGAHFDRWLQLWHSTVNEYFSGPMAEEAKQRSLMIAEVFKFRKGLTSTPLIRPMN